MSRIFKPHNDAWNDIWNDVRNDVISYPNFWSIFRRHFLHPNLRLFIRSFRFMNRSCFWPQISQVGWIHYLYFTKLELIEKRSILTTSLHFLVIWLLNLIVKLGYWNIDYRISPILFPCFSAFQAIYFELVTHSFVSLYMAKLLRWFLRVHEI